MTEVWQWYASTDGEHYTVGPEDSRDAVIHLATNDFDGEPFTIVEATKGEPTLRIFGGHGRDVIELLDDANEGKGDPDGDGLFYGVTRVAADALASALNNEIENWAAAFSIDPHVWAFGATRNQEDITPGSLPHPTNEESDLHYLPGVV